MNFEAPNKKTARKIAEIAQNPQKSGKKREKHAESRQIAVKSDEKA